MADETQLDRIERQLGELLALRDLLFKLYMPKVPAPVREKVARLMADRSRT
jgi:hypothetical protein